jgi:trimeric autotransporter adhesin
MFELNAFQAAGRIAKLTALICLLSASIPAGYAQVTSGTILGTVTDPSGASVPNAKVVITNIGTNIRSETVTSNQGNFEQPYLPAGQYQVAVDAPGFSSYLQTNIALNTDEKFRADVRLTVGNASQNVVVAANAVTLQTDSSQLSQTIDQRQVEGLPNINRNPLLYAATVAGITTTGAFLDPNNVNTGDNTRQNFSSFVVNGSRPLSTNIQLDGAMDTSPYGNEISVLPNIEAIGEVQVITNAYSAEYGRAAGGVINFTTRSGTNQVHGALYEDFRNSALNANTFGNNTFGRKANGDPVRPKAPFNTNLYGGAFSGPIWLPKVYNGHNRTFFFVSYEGLRRAQGASTYYTVPTAAERTGDFSKTLSLVTSNGVQYAEPVNIYLPLPSTTTTTQVAAGQYQLNRQQASYNGVRNVLSPQYLSQASLNLMNLYPLPNITPVNADGTNNYFTNATTYTHTDQWIVKLDHNFSDTQKGFFRWTTDWTLSNPPNIFAGTNPAANNNGPTTQFNPSFTLGYDWTISPRDVLELRANLTRINLVLEPIGGLNYNLTSLGFSQSELVGLPTQAFPSISIGSYPAMGLGSFVLRNNHSSNYSFTPNYTKVANKWTFKVGGEYLDILYNFTQPYKASMSFAANAAGFSAACSGTGCPVLPTTTVQGWAPANFLIGAVDGGLGNGQYTTGDPTMALKNGFWSAYSQNDWRATRKLTINLGLRWEFQGPLTERYNRLSQFNLGGVNETGTAGLYQFSGVNGNPRWQTNANWKNFAPRVGFAYQLGSKTVIRSAYGITYDMITGVGSGAQGFGSDGFSSPAYVQIRPASGLDILQNQYTNAFRSGGVTAGANPMNPVLLGQNVTAFIRTDSKIPYTQQWNFTIQRELPGSLDLQVAYVGTKGTALAIQQTPVNQTNDIPQATLNSGLGTYVATGINPLTSLVTNPFYGTIATNSNLNNSTIQQQYLNLPYPAYGGVTRFQDRLGSSSYNALQVTVRRAFATGFQITGAYTWSKSIDFGGAYTAQVQTGATQGSPFYSPTNQGLDRSISAFDSPQRVVISYLWELPLGKGKPFLANTPVVNHIVGGWKVGGITTLASGFPLGIGYGGGGFNRVNINEDPNLPAKDQIVGDGHTITTLPDGHTIVVPVGYKLIFNPYAFSVPILTVPQAGSPGKTVNVANPYFYGDAPRLFTDLRGPGTANWDVSLSRVFGITEKIKLEARLDAFNVFNRVQMGTPNTSFGSPNLNAANGALGLSTSSTFGMISTATAQTAVGQSTNIPRYLQISMRLSW